jgi:osmotically-inducible protein OsmY
MVLRSDAEIRAAVLDELAWDCGVTAAGIDVTVSQGVVALTGTVPNEAERLAAEADAHHLHGVLDVVDEIEVRSADSPLAIDTAIARAARRALIEDRVLPEAHIHVTVSHALLRLDGDVDCWGQRARAEQIMKQLAGVCGVVNAMEVSTSQPEPRESSHDEYRP